MTTISNNHEPEVAAWGNNGYAVADGGYVYTSDSGATWHKVSIFTGSEAFVAAWGTNVVVAGETKGSSSVIKVEASHNSGVTFTSPFTVSQTITDSWAPMVNVWGNLMYVAWRSNPGSFNSQEYVAVSNDAGVSWGTPIPIGVSGRDNQIAFHDRNFWVRTLSSCGAKRLGQLPPVPGRLLYLTPQTTVVRGRCFPV